MAAIPTQCNAMQWEEWGSQSKCTSSCGGGSKVRIRGCPTEPASACDGDPTETATCSSDSTNLGVFLKAELFLFLVHLAGNRKFLLFLQVLLLPGQSGANGLSATPLGSTARSSGLASVPMLPRLLPVMATQLRRLHAHQSPQINRFAKMLPIQVISVISLSIIL